MLPFFGPKTLRSLAGDLTDVLFNPLLNIDDTNLKMKASIINILQDRSDLSTFEEELDNSFDPYQYIKDSYIQNRKYKIYNGDIAEDDEELDFDFEKVTEKSKDNPVFYVQYAYARINSIFRLLKLNLKSKIKKIYIDKIVQSK